MGKSNMIMGSGPRLRTCVELVDHGVDAAGHAPATTDQHHERDRNREGLLVLAFDPWQGASSFLDLAPDPLADAFAEAREA